MKEGISHRLAPWITFIVFGTFLAFGWTQRYTIYDYARTYNYEPPARIAAIADTTTMNDATTRMFYAYHPSLEGKDTFAQHCTVTEKTNVLGCYVSSRGIYLYDITDQRLTGVEEVTAAHEVLHAAYERLSSSKRDQINALLMTTYRSITDDRIRETIASYEESGADILNELHSILATEIVDLPEELEDYYADYFDDRGAIVRIYQTYQSEFTQRRDRVEAADVQLEQMKSRIDSLNSSIDNQAKVINQEYTNLISLRDEGRIADYNNGVAAYNQHVSSYNTDVKTVQQLIEEYNRLVEQRNAIAIEEYELSKAIDSRPTTIQTQ